MSQQIVASESAQIKTEFKQSLSGQSPTKTDVEIKREKKKKSQAFKSFLKTETPSEVTPQRKMSGGEQTIEEKVEEDENCKICRDELSERRKPCQFCKDIVCLEHIRKKRKYKNTGKFVRICDDCQDKYLYQKHNKLELKAEQSLASQELIITTKHDQLKQLLENKQVKLQVLLNKKKDMEEDKKAQESKLNATQNEAMVKSKKLESKILENKSQQIGLQLLEDSLPRPLEDDYNCLLEQNNKITKELVKYEKLCNQALKSKSVKEKLMYDEYYEWERKQNQKKAMAKNKNDQCTIY